MRFFGRGGAAVPGVGCCRSWRGAAAVPGVGVLPFLARGVLPFLARGGAAVPGARWCCRSWCARYSQLNA